MNLKLFSIEYKDPSLQHLGSIQVYAPNQAQAEWIVENIYEPQQIM